MCIFVFKFYDNVIDVGYNCNKISWIDIDFKMEFFILFCDVLVIFLGINNDLFKNYIYVFIYEWFLWVFIIFW